MAQKFNELGDALGRRLGSGVIVSLGPLTALIHEDSASQQQEAACYVVSQLTGLLKAHQERLWLIGTAENYETYLKFLSRFPTAEKDWDLHLLPITYRSSSSTQKFPPSKSRWTLVFFTMASQYNSSLDLPAAIGQFDGFHVV